MGDRFDIKILSEVGGQCQWPRRGQIPSPLRLQRLALGMSTADVSKKTGFSITTLASLEKGELRLFGKYLMPLSELYGRGPKSILNAMAKWDEEGEECQ